MGVSQPLLLLISLIVGILILALALLFFKSVSQASLESFGKIVESIKEFISSLLPKIPFV